MTNTFALYRGHGALAQARRIAANRYSAVRCPHHTSSAPSILGQLQQTEEGGRMRLQPGELTLAGSGYLILDELPEFSWTIIEELGRHWRRGYLVLRSRWSSIQIPTHCAILACALRCPCGRLGEDPKFQACACTPEQVRRYEARVRAAAGCFEVPRGARAAAGELLDVILDADETHPVRDLAGDQAKLAATDHIEIIDVEPSS